MMSLRDLLSRRRRSPFAAYGADPARWPAGRAGDGTADAAADAAEREVARRLDALLDKAAPWPTAVSEARLAVALSALPAQRKRRWFLPFAFPAAVPARAPWPAFAAFAMASVLGVMIGGSDIGASIIGGSDVAYSVLDDTPALTAALEP